MIPGPDSDAGARQTDVATEFEPKPTENGTDHKILNESDDAHSLAADRSGRSRTISSLFWNDADSDMPTRRAPGHSGRIVGNPEVIGSPEISVHPDFAGRIRKSAKTAREFRLLYCYDPSVCLRTRRNPVPDICAGAKPIS